MELTDIEKIKLKLSSIFQEIVNIKWQGILNTYHPDIICDYQESFKIFTLYKKIYEEFFIEKKDLIELTLEDQRLLLVLYKIGKI